MRQTKIALVFSFLLVFIPSSVNAQGWEHITGGLPPFWAISAVDSNVCWVAGDRLLVMRTTNGSSFTEFTNGLVPENYYAIYARSASLVWVANRTQIFKTTNGGTNWSMVYEYTGTGAEFCFFDAIYFWDDLTGIAISDQVLANPNTMLIVRTTDGGTTWNIITEGLPVGNALYGYVGTRLDVVGDHCWFPVQSGSDADTTSQRFLIHSRNAGLTWESISLPANFGYFGVSFSDTAQGLITGSFGHIAQTTNGGQTWQMRYDGIAGQVLQFAKGTGTVWARGPFDNTYGYLVAKSTDYGSTWTTQTKPVRTSIYGFSVVNQDYVWACGSNNLILRTRSGGSVTGVNLGDDDGDKVPVSFELLQNYPNPFNPVTVIKYRIEQSGPIRLLIYDYLGREIRTLAAGYQNAGWHQLTWDGRDNSGRNVAAGVYFYTVTTAAAIETKKMILLK